MNTIEQWNHETYLIEYLAHQLIRGRLGLFLGAGVSQFFDLPSWTDLLSALSVKNGGDPMAAGDNLITKASAIRARHYKGQTERYIKDIKDALYASVSGDFSDIRLNATLSAIGSLVMSSRRGSAAKVFTLNYDNLLEKYLEFHGFTTASVHQQRHWAEDEDVVIYHPHGFLPHGDTKGSSEVILDTIDYHQLMQSPLWRPLLLTALRTHTFLYIGLSGDDMHLQSLLTESREQHAIMEERTLFSGVRFSTKPDDDTGVLLAEMGVFTHRLEEWTGLSDFLFRICQAARDIRLRRAS